VAEDRAIERVAAPDCGKGTLGYLRRSPHAITALLFVSLLLISLLFAAPAIAGRLNEIDGTASADRIRGTSASDHIRGGDGSDVLHGWAGDDRLVGGPGDDVLVGGPGQDSYVCGGGEDVVVGDLLLHAEHFGNGCEAAISDL